jgi:RHS repeat-associated protein
MLKDDEVKGSGNSYDFGARIYDSRLGRWLSVDPLASEFHEWSPYNYSFDSPVTFIDDDGRKPDWFVNKITGDVVFAKGRSTLLNSYIDNPQDWENMGPDNMFKVIDKNFIFFPSKAAEKFMNRNNYVKARVNIFRISHLDLGTSVWGSEERNKESNDYKDILDSKINYVKPKEINTIDLIKTSKTKNSNHPTLSIETKVYRETVPPDKKTTKNKINKEKIIEVISEISVTIKDFIDAVK